MKSKAANIGLVLGIVFVILGFVYGNSGIWILGFICLALGIFARWRR